jgi:hypothetical protein
VIAADVCHTHALTIPRELLLAAACTYAMRGSGFEQLVLVAAAGCNHDSQTRYCNYGMTEKPHA